MADLAQWHAPRDTFGEDRVVARSMNAEVRNVQLVETRRRCMADLKGVAEVDEYQKKP